MQNFRALGSLFVVEVEFVAVWVEWCVWVGVNSNNSVKPNLRVGLGKVVVSSVVKLVVFIRPWSYIRPFGQNGYNLVVF